MPAAPRTHLQPLGLPQAAVLLVTPVVLFNLKTSEASHLPFGAVIGLLLPALLPLVQLCSGKNLALPAHRTAPRQVRDHLRQVTVALHGAT